MANQWGRAVGDTQALQCQIFQDGEPVNLIGVMGVQWVAWRLTPPARTQMGTGAATIVNAADGVVSAPAATITTSPGKIEIRFQVTDAAGIVRSYPDPTQPTNICLVGA